MSERLEKLSASLLRPAARNGGFEPIFAQLGFREPRKASTIWSALAERAGFALGPEGAGTDQARDAGAAAAHGPIAGGPPGAGAAVTAQLSRLIAEIASSPDPDMALLNLGRFVDALISPSQLTGSLLLETPLVHLLVVIFSSSHYLSDILVRNPGDVSWLIEGETLESFKSYRMYREELEAQVAPFGDQRRRLNSIKRYRRREILRIGTRDLLGLATVEEVTAELSFLADAVIETVVVLAARATAEREPWGGAAPAPGGPPMQARAAEPAPPSGPPPPPGIPYGRLAVISMGKLGGFELNYSSDIDLIYVCDAAAGAGEQAFYTALAQRITADLTEPTEEGYLYRVDLRLRPDGESGPLVVTTDEHLNYLLRRARPWERQALLKARHSAGHAPVADTFVDNVARVVFSALGEANPLPDILTMREKSLAQLTEGERRRNIKLMSGGIRDIESIAQALQLIHGRARPAVRSRNTLEALERLRHFGLLEDEVYESLSRGYRFFRTVEHRLQMLLDVRTHTLPEGEEELERLGARVAQSALTRLSPGTFRTELGRAIRRVQKLFDSFFRGQAPGEIPLVLSLPPGEREVARVLAKYGIREGETAHRFLSSLVYGDFPRLEHPETLQAAAASLPRILERIAESPDPSLALKNLVRIIKATGAVRSTLELLGAGGDLLRLLLVVAALSTRLTDTLTNRIELLDGLAAGPCPGEPPSSAAGPPTPPGEAPRAREGRPKAGHAEFIRRLKRWYEESLLSIHCLHPIPNHGPEVLGPALTEAAEGALRVIFGASCGDETRMALFALGSLAARRCRFGSDLDLVAVIPDDADPQPAAAALRGVIAAAREAGLPSVDPRLRGEGEGSPLAQTVGYYRRYFEERGDFWELLTFSRCRFLCGDRETADAFEHIVLRFSERGDVRKDFRSEFLAARGRLEALSKGAWDVKHASGGLYDINFILASVNLIVPRDGRRAVTWEDSIETLRARGLLQEEEIARLGNAFALYYLAQHAAALHGVPYPPLPEREDFLDSYLGRLLAPLSGGPRGAPETADGDHIPSGSGERFVETLERFKTGTREIFTRFAERVSRP